MFLLSPASDHVFQRNFFKEYNLGGKVCGAASGDVYQGTRVVDGAVVAVRVLHDKLRTFASHISASPTRSILPQRIVEYPTAATFNTASAAGSDSAGDHLALLGLSTPQMMIGLGSSLSFQHIEPSPGALSAAECVHLSSLSPFRCAVRKQVRLQQAVRYCALSAVALLSCE